MLNNMEYTLPYYRVILVHLVFFQQNVECVYAVVILHDVTWAFEMESDVNLLKECSYLEFISVLIFEDEGGWTNFINQI